MSKIDFSRAEEGRHPGEFIISESNGTRSRDTVVIAASQTVEPGQVLTATETGYVAWDGDAETSCDGVAIYGCQTAAGETASVVAVTRDAEVAGHSLVVPASADIADAAAGLAEVGIIVR